MSFGMIKCGFVIFSRIITLIQLHVSNLRSYIVSGLVNMCVCLGSVCRVGDPNPYKDPLNLVKKLSFYSFYYYSSSLFSSQIRFSLNGPCY